MDATYTAGFPGVHFYSNQPTVAGDDWMASYGGAQPERRADMVGAAVVQLGRYFQNVRYILKLLLQDEARCLWFCSRRERRTRGWNNHTDRKYYGGDGKQSDSFDGRQFPWSETLGDLQHNDR